MHAAPEIGTDLVDQHALGIEVYVFVLDVEGQQAGGALLLEFQEATGQFGGDVGVVDADLVEHQHVGQVLPEVMLE